MSGGDAAYLINNKQNLIIAQSGEEQFMYLRTGETPASVDHVALNNAQNARITQLISSGSDFSSASKTAAIETARNNGLAYYEGVGGVFKRVDP